MLEITSIFAKLSKVPVSFEENLSNTVARNYAKADATVASKNYNVQSYAPVQDSAKIFLKKHTYS